MGGVVGELLGGVVGGIEGVLVGTTVGGLLAFGLGSSLPHPEIKIKVDKKTKVKKLDFIWPYKVEKLHPSRHERRAALMPISLRLAYLKPHPLWRNSVEDIGPFTNFVTF